MASYELQKESRSYNEENPFDQHFSEKKVIEWAEAIGVKISQQSSRKIRIDNDIEKALRVLRNVGEFLEKREVKAND